MGRDELKKVQMRDCWKQLKELISMFPIIGQKCRKQVLAPRAFIRLMICTGFLSQQADLRDNYPFGLFAVPLSEIVRIHASSGLRENNSGGLYPSRYCHLDRGDGPDTDKCRCRQGCIIQVAYGYGLFTEGWDFIMEVKKSGLILSLYQAVTLCVRSSYSDFGSTVLACTPRMPFIL
jgi:phenylacetate-CoA ligase